MNFFYMKFLLLILPLKFCSFLIVENVAYEFYLESKIDFIYSSEQQFI